MRIAAMRMSGALRRRDGNATGRDIANMLITPSKFIFQV